MRNIQDFKARIKPGSESLGSSRPFNVITEALTLPNFSQDDIRALYSQHTKATGQVFESGAIQMA
jgi:hypothetical protein